MKNIYILYAPEQVQAQWHKCKSGYPVISFDHNVSEKYGSKLSPRILELLLNTFEDRIWITNANKEKKLNITNGSKRTLELPDRMSPEAEWRSDFIWIRPVITNFPEW